MVIFEGDKFLSLSRSAGGKVGTERERGAEFPGGKLLHPPDFMLKVGRNRCLRTHQPSLLPYARNHKDYR